MGVAEADFAAQVWEHSTSGICAVDADGSLVMINAAARRTLGGACATAPLGTPCEQALADYPTLARLLREALAGRPALSRAELCADCSDGERRVIGFSITTLPDAAGAIRGAAVVFRDLAPIERSGERERLQQRLAALGEMAAGLAHELRNPLAGMEVIAGLLQRRLSGQPDALVLVAELRSQIRQLGETVTASLDYLRPVALMRESIDLAEVADEAIVFALARAPRPDRIDRRYAAALPRLAADRQLLGIALVNLIANACEAMAEVRPTGRESRLALAVEVGAAPELMRPVRVDRDPTDAAPASRELRIAVGDNGPGISEEIRDRIFDPFFTTRASGSGIGLANVQKIVHAHGGSLSLESSPHGSVFQIHLPLPSEAT
jgi:PAS domain S-box-containing protein